jgi:hypothetical protein
MKFQLAFVKKKIPVYRRGLKGAQYSTLTTEHSSVSYPELDLAVKSFSTGSANYKFDIKQINTNYNHIQKNTPDSKGKLFIKSGDILLQEINADNLRIKLNGIMNFNGLTNGFLKLLIEIMLHHKLSSVDIEFELI